LEEFGNGKGKLAKASEEGQGPRRAVEPMMMMMSDAIQEDLDAIIFNPIASIILIWLRFKYQIFSFAQQWGIGNQDTYFTKDSEIILH
jgi:hypothetical protein